MLQEDTPPVFIITEAFERKFLFLETACKRVSCSGHRRMDGTLCCFVVLSFGCWLSVESF